MHEEKMRNLKHVLYKLIMNGKNIAMEWNGSCVEEMSEENEKNVQLDVVL